MSVVILQNRRVTECKVLKRKRSWLGGHKYLTQFTARIDNDGLAGSKVAIWIRSRNFICIDENELQPTNTKGENGSE